MIEIDIDKLARLARLHLKKEAKERIASSLPKIIEYFQTIKHLGQKSVPTFPISSCFRRKEEEAIHQEIKFPPEFLKRLPNFFEGYFCVPKIKE